MKKYYPSMNELNIGYSRAHLFKNDDHPLGQDGNKRKNISFYVEDISHFLKDRNNKSFYTTNTLSCVPEVMKKFMTKEFINNTSISQNYIKFVENTIINKPEDFFNAREYAIDHWGRSAVLNHSFSSLPEAFTRDEKLEAKEREEKISENQALYTEIQGYYNPNKKINIHYTHLDDLFFNGDTVKVFKVDNPQIHLGYPTTDKGYLYVFNRYKVDRLTKFYIPNGGRLLGRPRNWFHSEKMYYVPKKTLRAYNTLYEGVHSYDFDMGVTYLGDNDTFYDRYKGSFKSVLKSYLENTYIDKSMLYFNDSGAVSSVNNKNTNLLSDIRYTDIYDVRNNGNSMRYNDRHNTPWGEGSREGEDYMLDTFEKTSQLAKYEEDNKYRYIYKDLKYMGIDHLMGNTAIVIEDPDCVVQMYVTPKRTYIRSNNDAETIYRHTALKNNPYLDPVEGLIRDLPPENEGKLSRIINKNSFGSNEFRFKQDKYNSNRLVYDYTKSKLIKYLNNADGLRKFSPNTNLLPNHVHFMDEWGTYNIIRPLFRNSPSWGEDEANVRVDIPSNLYIPKGLIYTEFGFFRDDTTTDEELRNSLNEYNEQWKINSDNHIDVIKRYVIMNNDILKDADEKARNNFRISDNQYTSSNYEEMNKLYNDPEGIFLTTEETIPRDESNPYFKWDETKKRFVMNRFIPLVNYTGEVVNGVDKVVSIGPIKVALMGDRNLPFKKAWELTPFLQNEVDENGKMRYFIYGLKGDGLVLTNRDIIKNVERYVNLPKLPYYLEPKKSFTFEGQELKDYLQRVFGNNYHYGGGWDKLDFPGNIVGILTNNDNYPIYKWSTFTIDDLFGDREKNRNTWDYGTFMEKVKRGYPYRDEVVKRINKKRDMKWTKWTSFYYPDSDRHDYDETEFSDDYKTNDIKNDYWRHNIDENFIRKVLNKIIPDEEKTVKKYENEFTNYVQETDDFSRYSSDRFYIYNYVKNVFGNGYDNVDPVSGHSSGGVQQFYFDSFKIKGNIYLGENSGIFHSSTSDYGQNLLIRNGRYYNMSFGAYYTNSDEKNYIHINAGKLNNIVVQYSEEDVPKRNGKTDAKWDEDMNKFVNETLKNDSRYHMFAINTGQKRWKTLIDVDLSKFPDYTPYMEYAKNNNIPNGDKVKPSTPDLMRTKRESFLNDLSLRHNIKGTITFNPLNIPLNRMYQIIELPKFWKDIVVEPAVIRKENNTYVKKWVQTAQRRLIKEINAELYGDFMIITSTLNGEKFDYLITTDYSDDYKGIPTVLARKVMVR